MPLINYCFYCDEAFTPSDSIAANTPHEHSQTYCSRMCYDKDTEQMELDIKAAALQDQQTPEATTIPVVEEVKIGGFKLNVRRN